MYIVYKQIQIINIIYSKFKVKYYITHKPEGSFTYRRTHVTMETKAMLGFFRQKTSLNRADFSHFILTDNFQTPFTSNVLLVWFYTWEIWEIETRPIKTWVHCCVKVYCCLLGQTLLFIQTYL